MTELPWYKAIAIIRPYIVKVLTPMGQGTGFLVAASADRTLCSVATAAHVVSHAHEWTQPIRIEHPESSVSITLRDESRAVYLEPEKDTADIVFLPGKILVPEEMLPLTPKGKYLNQGIEVGWLGFPALSPNQLCFFSGSISSYIMSKEIYLVDGVAINGVSGGPAFFPGDDGTVVVIGVISAYIPNRATGEALPGLCAITDVTQFHEVIRTFRSLEEAKKEEKPPSSSASQVSNAPQEDST